MNRILLGTQWAMLDGVPGAGTVIADDESNGYTLEGTDQSGNYHRYVNHGDGTFSGTLRVSVEAGPLTFYSQSSITDTDGQVTKQVTKNLFQPAPRPPILGEQEAIFFVRQCSSSGSPRIGG